MAYVCRYGHVSIVAAMEIPQSDMVYFLEAINGLIGDENKVSED